MIYDIFDLEQEITTPFFLGSRNVIIPSEKIVSLDIQLQSVAPNTSSSKPTYAEVRSRAGSILGISKGLGRRFPPYRGWDFLFRGTFEILILLDPLDRIE